MTQFQKGDSVRLLHSKETGIITAILPDKKVRVLIDEILEMELSENEICHAEISKTLQAKTVSTITPLELKDGIYLGLSLVKDGFVEIYLLNHTSYQLLYAVFRYDEPVVIGRSKGEISPRQTRSLYSIRNAEWEAESQILFQYLSFSADAHPLISPKSIPVKIANRFLRKEPQKIPGIQDPLIIISLEDV